MDGLRRLSSVQRFAVVLLGSVVGNVGRFALDGISGTLLLAVGSAMVVTALGLVELTVWGWHQVRRRIESRRHLTES